MVCIIPGNPFIIIRLPFTKVDAGKFPVCTLLSSPLVENVFCFHVSTNFRRQILAFHDQSKSNPEGELLTPLRLEERADRKLKK